MATPHVTGVVALVRTLTPTLDVATTIGRILNNADVIPGLTNKVVGGRRLNAFGAVNTGPPAPDLTGPRITAAQPNGSTSVSSVRLTFNEAINPFSFDTSDIANVGSLTIMSVAVVSGSGNKQFDVTFNAVTTPGGYGFDVGPDITDTAGNAMDQNTDGVSNSLDVYHVSFTVSSTLIFSNNTPAQIRDFTTTNSTITINQDVTISDINVKLNITHTWDSDLYITIKSPWGTSIVLSNRRGGSGDNFSNTIFDDEAAVPISSGVAPFAGSYRPDGLLSTFDNRNARGTWTLSVADRGWGDIGTLNSWSVTITPAGSGAGASIASVATVGSAAESIPVLVKSGGLGVSSLTAFDVSFGGGSQSVGNPVITDGNSSIAPSVRAGESASAESRQNGPSREALDLLFTEFGVAMGDEASLMDALSTSAECAAAIAIE